jgi:branched-chain amino acid transport system ATP-binding protein
MLDVHGLTTTYGPVTALDDVTFSAPEGKITAVLGANGAGKTTLLRTLSGLIRPAKGTVTLAGTDLVRTAPEAMSSLGLAHVPDGARRDHRAHRGGEPPARRPGAHGQVQAR